MPRTQNIYRATRAFQPFPEPESVLGPVEAQLLLPIGVFDFGKVDPAHPHPVLIALPIEPESDLIGSTTRDFHTDSCQENWVGYHWQDGLWRLDCDPRFFLSQHEDAADDADLQAHYAACRRHYEAVKAFFRQHGFIQYRRDDPADKANADALFTRWDTTPDGNWAQYQSSVTYTLDDEGNESEPVVTTASGDVCHYVGTVTEYHFKDSGDTAHFFYEPKSRSVRMVTDYS